MTIMCIKLVFCLFQVLAVKNVFSYPVRDNIMAYIPIEELMYLDTTDIQYVSLPYELVLIEEYEPANMIIIDEMTYYGRPNNGGRPGTLPTYQGFQYYTTSPAYQPATLPTVSILPSAACTPAPSIVIDLPTTPPTLNQYEVYENTEEIIENGNTVIEYPAGIANTAFEYPAVIVNTEPASGSVTFNGYVPASGCVKIYAQYC